MRALAMNGANGVVEARPRSQWERTSSLELVAEPYADVGCRRCGYRGDDMIEKVSDPNGQTRNSGANG